MQLLATIPSPYARKCRASVIELGLEHEVETMLLQPRLPRDAKPDLEQWNPLSKVPALITEAGTLIDSRVICAYLNERGGGGLVPADADRWRSLALEALADGMCDAGVVIRLERTRPEGEQRADDIAAHSAKIVRALDRLEAEPPLGWHLGTLALACAIDWITFRALVPEPLAGRPRLAAALAAHAERPSLGRTRPG